jgi:hemerythrin
MGSKKADSIYWKWLLNHVLIADMKMQIILQDLINGNIAGL